MGEEYPVGAFIVTIIGAVFALLFWLIIALAGIVGVAMGAIGAGVCIIISIIGAVLGFLAAAWMRKPEKVHSGGILAIVAAIIVVPAIITIWGILPFILLLIGGILALGWKGPERKPVILPPPPPS